MVSQPLYVQIYEELISAIRSQKLRPGERIPSEKELAERYSVSRITSKRAIEMLADQGLVTRMRGKGSFVTKAENPRAGEVPHVDHRRGDTAFFGVVIPDFSESYGTGLLSGIEQECAKAGYFDSLRRSCGSQEAEEHAIEALLDFGADGIIVMPVHGEHYNPLIVRLVLDSYPIVLIDRHLSGIPTSFVGSDNVNAAKKATDYLISLGHRTLSIVSSPIVDASTIQDRVEGFVKSHAEHGVAVDEGLWLPKLQSTIPGNALPEMIEQDVERVQAHFSEHPEITAVVAFEYYIAVIVDEALGRIGRAVPQDCSIVCFDGPSSFVGTAPFTHIRQREQEMGATAVRLLGNKLEKRELNEKVFLDTDLIIGASTAPV